MGDEELRAQQEIHLQKQASIELDQKSKLFQTFKEAKDVLQLAVSDKKIFAEYLDSVVRIQADKYQDILQLMDRCQGLVTSRWVYQSIFWYIILSKFVRDDLKKKVQVILSKTDHEERELEKFKEQKMEQTLDYNVR